MVEDAAKVWRRIKQRYPGLQTHLLEDDQPQQELGSQRKVRWTYLNIYGWRKYQEILSSNNWTVYSNTMSDVTLYQIMTGNNKWLYFPDHPANRRRYFIALDPSHGRWFQCHQVSVEELIKTFWFMRKLF